MHNTLPSIQLLNNIPAPMPQRKKYCCHYFMKTEELALTLFTACCSNVYFIFLKLQANLYKQSPCAKQLVVEVPKFSPLKLL